MCTRVSCCPCCCFCWCLPSCFIFCLLLLHMRLPRAVWSKKLPMTNTPALLSLLDGPSGSDPAFFIIWSHFRQLRRCLACRPDEEERIFRQLDFASAGSPGHGPMHLLLESAEEIGLFWDSELAGWIRPGLPPLRVMTGSIKHSVVPYGKPGRKKWPLICARGKGFGVHFVSILSGGVWNGFLPSKAKKEDISCSFCNAPDSDGHLFWACTFPPFVELRNNPEFLPSMKRDRTNWPGCLLWHGWLPRLTSRSTGSPWAVAASDLACHNHEKALGPHSLSTHSTWHPFWDQDDAQDVVDDVPVHPLLREPATVSWWRGSVPVRIRT